ncbi:ATP-binding protein [Paenibacillus sp. Soil750]|uniref:ATP-binding protein n=1 Tax=Paenibacillus sp. Soil750 TaxID=1736398 RepID=UPI0007138D0B|nr:sensor histidine kinase [Paenibacillus sp. Soil750]KRE71986.1 hypothetical protein ASL11_09425 [Paenibacillus sp. Soil750]
MEKDTVNFKISSGLKNLIGKELITDELIAIFELVKNSFDAHAKSVKIFFENIYSNRDARIIIVDTGKGMDITDIEEKWLFVAYSAKKDGSEDNNELDDYRNTLKGHRGYAGAKGVGRFSCDRLGSKLNLITIKDKPESLIENIKINWEDFEKDSKEEFFEIELEHNVLQSHSYEIHHGTILEILDLRDTWDRTKLLKLKQSLEKLINPNQQSDEFSIELIVNEELEKDASIKDPRKKINGFVNNTIFEVLKVKTTRINTIVSEDGSKITTTLEDRGKLIYKTVENNPFSISGVEIELFYLNQTAKINFTKLMGIRPVRYGSIFMYKNGFRIYPFGEVGEDPLKLDARKTQGHSRYLGNRELIGRIEIVDHKDSFIETTSRDGGLIKNHNYEDLVQFFYDKALKKLERYVVNIIRWGEPYRLNKDDEEKQPALNPEDVKNDIQGIIKNLSASDEILSIEFDDDFLAIIEERQENSVTRTLTELTAKAVVSSDDPALHLGLEKLGRKVNKLIDERNQFEIETEEKTVELKKTTKELEQINNQNLFLKSIASADIKEIASLQHHIDHGTVKITRNLTKLAIAIENDAPKSELMSYVERISLENNKISTIARFVTKANFNTTSKSLTRDLVQFVNEYIENVYKDYEDLRINNQLLSVDISTPENLSFVCRFKPLEIIIIIDNLLSNSYKANSKEISISWKKNSDSKLLLYYQDDGKGIPESIIGKIFEFGFTTTDGSGLGLYHVKQMIESMGGKITVNNKVEKGVQFILEVHHGA